MRHGALDPLDRLTKRLVEQVPRATGTLTTTIEGVIVGAIGSLAGALFGVALTWYMVEHGIPVGTFFADGSLDMGNLPLTGSMYGEWKPLDIVVGFVFGVVVSFIAARIPARRAARLEVTDALRFV